MPGKVKVKIISGKNLPVMDRSSDTTDAYVEIKLGNTTYKTDVCRRTLHPHWNTDWYRFEVDDSELQDEPLQIRLMDHDTYSANDAIGKVYLNLNPLLLPVAGQLAVGDISTHLHEISGWIPVYDTMHGIRGEVNVTVKVELFSDFNRYRQSSCGVYFFYSPTVPQGYQAKIIHGFVEELIVDDDPEYQWIDKIRTPRASNEARQTLFFKLSGELQRKIGVKALNLGGNAVIGYKQSFDLEGESGIVARGIGTAVTLVKSFSVHHVVVETKEEDIQNYLKFVGDGKSFRLCSTLPAHTLHFPCSPITPLSSLDAAPLTTRAPKLTNRQCGSLESDVLGSSMSNPNLYESDKTSIKVLLNQEDKRGESAMSRRFQKFKHSQKSLSKKMIALKAKLNDSIGEEADEDSPSTTLDKRKYFKRTSSDSSAMAEILARSVIQATSSLSCILENQNLPKEDDTMQKLEPIANLLSKTESQTSIVDDNASDAQSYSSSDSSSSCSDYDYKYYGKSSNDVETISNIITNVERLQRCLSREGLHKQYSMPAIPTRGFSLSSLDSLGKFDNGSSFSEYKSRKETFMGPKGFEATSASIDSFSENLNEPPIEDHENNIQLKSIKNDLKKIDMSQSKTIKENVHSQPKGIALQTMVFEKSSILGTPESSNPFVYPYVQDQSNIETKPDSVMKTALQTMLLERVNLLGTPTKELGNDDITFPTSHKFRQAEDITPQSHLTDSAKHVRQNEPATDIFKKGNSRFPIKKNEDHKYSSKGNDDLKAKGIINTALKTMLFEKVNILGASADHLVENTKLQNKSQEDAVIDSNDAGADECNSDDDEYITIKNCKDTQSERETSQSLLCDRIHQGLSAPSTPDANGEIKVIAPINTKNISIEPRRMVKTAMQTMLLEKVNILGTYTPPTSPSLSGESPNVGGKTIFTFNEPSALRKKTNIPKSFSSSSFDERHRQRHKDTVLGMPFASLSSLTSEYEKCLKRDRLSCLSDSHLHKPMLETLKEKHHARKRRFKFLHTKSSNNNSNSKPGMFDKFLKHSKRNLHEDLQKEGAKEHHQNILSRMFHLHHEEKSIKDEETQTSNELLNEIIPFQTNQTPSNTPKIEISVPKSPGNTDEASGDLLAHGKTKLACITSNRHNSLPAQEKQDHGGEKKNEQSPDAVVKISHSPARVNYMVPLHRRSSDSDLSITPKGNSLTGSDRSVGNSAAYFMRNSYIKRGLLNQENFEMLEYPFVTITKFSPRFVVQMGGSVSSRSVKLLERISNPEEPESRDSWWSELRMEIRSHARTLNCNAVLGYTELISICEDVCVLSACGTAAVVDLNYSMGDEYNILTVQRNMEKEKNLNDHHRSSHDSPDHREQSLPPCTVTHLPYDDKTAPVKAHATKCSLCSKGKVPEVLLATIEPTEALPSIGKGCFIEAQISRLIKDLRGENIAKEISEGLPFLEYELHRLLVNKLKIRGMNAIFSLKVRITVGEKMLVGIATGTAMYLSSLPTPALPIVVTNKESEEKIVANLQEMLKETVKKNREIYQIPNDNQNHKPISDDDSDEEQGPLDISYGNKDCCILEMDDPEDAEVLKLLMEEKIPDGFHVVSTESVLGLEDLEIVKNLQMFTQIYRAKLAPPYNLQKHFVRLLQSVYFKLRRMVPCALCDLQYRVDLPEADEIQLCVIGMALGLGKKVKKTKPLVVPRKPEDDLMFKLDEDPHESPTSLVSKSTPSSLKYRGHRSPSKYRTQSLKQRNILSSERHGVDITPLSYVPGGIIEQYLGNLNFFFIRETTSIREEGGLSGFIHSFVTEVLAIVRSHVTALGGNALVAFFMTECVLNHNLHKNQGQCLINVGGDVVFVSYFKDDS